MVNIFHKNNKNPLKMRKNASYSCMDSVHQKEYHGRCVSFCVILHKMRHNKYFESYLSYKQ